MEEVVIIGAGITGLTTAYWLKKEGFKVKILEASNDVGGNIKTIKHKDFIFDTGPNSGLETTQLISQLVNELNLQDEFIYADKSANKRYILRNDILHPLPMSPKDFLTTKLFSSKAKFRVMLEPFIGKSKDGYYQSLAEFVRRRLGQEFLDYAINPFVSGVFAGDPENLSVKSAFPKLYRLEEVYGGLFKGMIKGAKERKKRAEKSKQNAAMFSFKSGMSALPKKLAEYLRDEILLNHPVKNILKNEDGYTILLEREGEQKTLQTKSILFTIPAYITAEILKDFDGYLYNQLSTIYYPPVLVLNVIYDKSKIGQPLDGFGFLIPEKENKSFLGAIWNSAIFPNRGDDKFASFTIFVGGARQYKIFDLGFEKLIQKVLSEFEEIMRIESNPESIEYRFWEKAIPQYSIGYIEKENALNEFERKFKGIFFGGNYRGGISIGDCIKNSKIHFERISNFVRNNLLTEFEREIN
ncbi:MAG: protoporphyrinogen oxidase [Ignavibacteria bacterium]